ncbi:hypothetical protein BURK2_01454 [Burkholderiales bacterium]|nr:hypothetical protein BURK2_01454 [Burkholderiales bacterium]
MRVGSSFCLRRGLGAVLGFAAALWAAGAVAQTAGISVEKVDAPDPVIAGANLSYTITINNEGPANAANAALSDTLPAGTTFVSLTAPPGWSCTTPAVGATGTVSCTNASMAVGSELFTLVVQVAAAIVNGATISNTATITATTTDSDPSDNTATATTTVATEANLSLTKTDAPDPVLPGALLTYSITVNNAGPSDAANALLTDVLPAGTTFASLTSPGGWSCVTPAVGAGGTVSCSNAAMAPGSAAFTLAVTVSGALAGGSTLSNTATISSDTTDPNAGNNSATATTAVATPATVGATKTVAGSFVPGGTVSYTIVLTNSGPAAQANNPGDEFIDVLPATLTLVGATSSSGTVFANLPGNTVTWNGAIPVAGTVTITITATIPPALTGMQTISNQGQVNYDADGNGSNEASTLTDNPGLPGSQDATAFAAIGSVAPIPAMGGMGWLLLSGLLLMAAWRVIRRPTTP